MHVQGENGKSIYILPFWYRFIEMQQPRSSKYVSSLCFELFFKKKNLEFRREISKTILNLCFV